jgi:hypothetical protein
MVRCTPPTKTEHQDPEHDRQIDLPVPLELSSVSHSHMAAAQACSTTRRFNRFNAKSIPAEKDERVFTLDRLTPNWTSVWAEISRISWAWREMISLSRLRSVISIHAPSRQGFSIERNDLAGPEGIYFIAIFVPEHGIQIGD